jgi:RimJ/RimL family protein N-acetyltransferase
MNLEFKPFQREYYAEYASWFADPDLNHQLGPMDEEWLEAILSEPEAAGITWAVFRGPELVAVVETFFDPQNELPAGFSAVAVKPTLRRQGIGSAALQELITRHHNQGFTEHIAYVSTSNPAGRRLIEKAGFVPAASEPNEYGYLEFRQRE